MKILLITMAVLFALPIIGFFLQWVRWEVIPTVKDKIKEKKLKKFEKKL
jgi:hypothetical protein